MPPIDGNSKSEHAHMTAGMRTLTPNDAKATPDRQDLHRQSE
jgi:hypothetical protein